MASDLLSVILCCCTGASIPNFKTLEVDVDDVPWKDDIVTFVPTIINGILQLPSSPGWGIDIDEDALKLHPTIDDVKTGIW